MVYGRLSFQHRNPDACVVTKQLEMFRLKDNVH